MRVAYFGTYSVGPGYPRNRVIIEGLRRRGIDVVECHVPLWGDEAERHNAVFRAARLVALTFRLLWAWVRLAARYLRLPRHDAVIVGYMGHFDVLPARALAALRRARPVVLDAFLSPWDTVVNDRRLLGRRSARARLLRCAEALAYRCADVVLADTAESAEFLRAEFGLRPEKVTFAPVGSLASLEAPSGAEARGAAAGAGCTVLFFGTYIPLHGVTTIAEAARLLASDREIRLVLVGRGQELNAVRELVRRHSLANVILVERFMPYGELTAEVGRADVCLGIFGQTQKAARVVPCKVFDCMCLGKAVITADTPAARWVIEDGETGLLVPAGDPAALAEAIRRLCGDADLRRRLGAAAAAAFRARFMPEHVVENLVARLRLKAGEK